MLDLSKKLKIAMLEVDVTQAKLAQRTEQSQQNLSRKIVANNFNIGEYERLVKALGCELEVNIVTPDGKRL